MALLFDESDPTTRYSMEITPLPIEPDGPEDAYAVALRRGEQLVFSETCTGHSDEMGHYYLTLIGEAFRGARAILETQVRFVSRFDETYETPATIQVGSYFVTLSLTGYAADDSEWLDVEIRLATDWSKPPTGFLQGCQSAWLRCSLPAAERFGSELLGELRVITEADLARYRAGEETDDALPGGRE